VKKRLVTFLVAFCFLATAVSAAAQFPIKKKKEEKPAEKKEEKADAKPVSSETLKSVTWADNGITFQIPDNWQAMMEERDMDSFMLMPATDGAGLTGTISRMGKDFPAAASLKATRDDAAKKKQNGEFVSHEDMTLGKVKGVMYVEAAKAAPDDVRRLTWIGFQKRNGWNQVILHLSAKSGAFADHEATFRKVLATFKIESE